MIDDFTGKHSYRYRIYKVTMMIMDFLTTIYKKCLPIFQILELPQNYYIVNIKWNAWKIDTDDNTITFLENSFCQNKYTLKLDTQCNLFSFFSFGIILLSNWYKTAYKPLTTSVQQLQSFVGVLLWMPLSRTLRH